MRLVGIDMAADARNCAICVLEDKVVQYVRLGTRADEHPEWLMELCSGASVVAVDVPFGWPEAFIEALQGYEVGVALDRDRRRYVQRTTDSWIVETAPQLLHRRARPPHPLAVAADKLGVTAMVGTLLLSRLAEDFCLSPREHIPSPASIEVYPAASLWAWGLPYRDLETDVLLQRLQRSFDLTICPTDREKLLESRHGFDALVAALTAWEYAGGNTCDPPRYVSDVTLRMEGWIRIPDRLLGGELG